MKYICLLFLTAACAFGQTPAPAPTPTPAPASSNPSNIYGAGISYNNAGSPAIAGSGIYVHLLNDGSGTYTFTAIDVLPTNLKPFTVTTNIGAGVAQKIFSIHNVPVFIPSSAGVSWSGTNTGWAWTTGAMACIKFKQGWWIMPNVRFAKSNISNGAGIQPIVGAWVAWGQ